MMKLGLKIWSINHSYVNIADDLYNQKVFDYIELYSVPGSLDSSLLNWEKLSIPFIIHAPHFKHGFNLSDKELAYRNTQMFDETRKFADSLHAEKIIVHPGINGNIDETVSQLVSFQDQRILIENKPYYSIWDKSICIGNSPTQIKYIIDNTHVGFCLDIAHAIYSANAQDINYFDYLSEFIKLKPFMFHLSNGDKNSVVDMHYHLNAGNLNIQKIIRMIPKPAIITIETEKESDTNLDSFVADIRYLRELL